MRSAPAKMAIGARGTLVTFTVIRKAPAAFALEPLYAVALVDLDGGGRVIGRIDPFEPAPRPGAPVRLMRWTKEIPVFAPA